MLSVSGVAMATSCAGAAMRHASHPSRWAHRKREKKCWRRGQMADELCVYWSWMRKSSDFFCISSWSNLYMSKKKICNLLLVWNVTKEIKGDFHSADIWCSLGLMLNLATTCRFMSVKSLLVVNNYILKRITTADSEVKSANKDRTIKSKRHWIRILHLVAAWLAQIDQIKVFTKASMRKNCGRKPEHHTNKQTPHRKSGPTQNWRQGASWCEATPQEHHLYWYIPRPLINSARLLPK